MIIERENETYVLVSSFGTHYIFSQAHSNGHSDDDKKVVTEDQANRCVEDNAPLEYRWIEFLFNVLVYSKFA